MTSLPALILIVATVATGLLVGVESAVAVVINPILDRLPGDGGLLGRADGARVLGRVMPFWYVGSIVLAVAAAVAAWSSGVGPLLLAAAVTLALSVVLSLTVLVPINNRVATWSAGDAPADWRAQVARWDRVQVVRLLLIGAGFVLLVISAVAAAR